MLCLLLFCIGTGLSFGLSLLVLYLQWCFSSLGQVFQACSSLLSCLSTVDIRLGVISGSVAYYATHGLAQGISKLCTSILFAALPYLPPFLSSSPSGGSPQPLFGGTCGPRGRSKSKRGLSRIAISLCRPQRRLKHVTMNECSSGPSPATY